METGVLSSNWKKLQASLKSTKPTESPSKAVPKPNHGVKRKREPLRPGPLKKPAAQQAQKPRKKARMETSVTQNGVSKSPKTIQDLENAETALPLRAVRAAADLVNCGLSTK